MSRKTAPLLTLAFLAAAAIGLSACNTIAGAGKDTSALGHDVTGGANSTQNSIHKNTGAANN